MSVYAHTLVRNRNAHALQYDTSMRTVWCAYLHRECSVAFGIVEYADLDDALRALVVGGKSTHMHKRTAHTHAGSAIEE
jgi:hypothetical protein